MNLLFRELYQLCLFRASPARLPDFALLTGLLLLADWLLSVVVVSFFNSEYSIAQMTLNIGVAQVAIGLLVYAALRLRQRDARWSQTLSAIYGCDLLLTALFGLLLPLGQGLGESAFMMLRILLQLWTVSVYGYILHLAMEVPLIAGILAAFGVLILALSLTQALVGL